MTLECELAELRKQKSTEWEKTKHHLRLAKSKSSLNIQDIAGEVETKSSTSHKHWEKQPMVIAKSCWITMDAGRSVQERAKLRIAATLLGIHILEEKEDAHEEDLCNAAGSAA